MTNWDGWEEQQARDLEAEAADEWVTEQATTVHAAAGMTGPWGALHPIAWSYCTGRITAGSVPEWRQRYDADPTGVANALALCVPALGPQAVHAAAGLTTAAGVVSHLPATEASPARPRGFRTYVDELRSTHPGLVAAAERGGPPPSMFAEGDQPRSTASGIPVAAIAALPWPAKLAAAWEPSLAAAFRMSQDYGDALGEDAARMELAGHPVVTRYVNEVEHWARNSGVGDTEPLTEIEASALFPPSQQPGD